MRVRVNNKPSQPVAMRQTNALSARQIQQAKKLTKAQSSTTKKSLVECARIIFKKKFTLNALAIHESFTKKMM
jgi:hypothetical protein